MLEAVGETPIIQLPQLDPECEANIFAKLELFNPSGSVKDRIARYIVDKAERTGELRPDSIIVEVTSGNTGIALSMVAAACGYAICILMPEHMSKERAMIMRALGAEVVLTPEADGFLGALEISRKMAADNPKVFLPRQFENHANVEAHKYFTATEIMRQMGNDLDAFVAGIGTGGTLMGVAEAFEEARIKAKICAVEPAEAPVLTGGEPGKHRIQGLGDGFLPSLVEVERLDDVINVSSEDAIQMAIKLTAKLGLLVGISSGANVFAAVEEGKKLGKGKNVVTVIPDRGERYFSTEMFTCVAQTAVPDRRNEEVATLAQMAMRSFN
jgi:cysteine synthase A